MYFWTDVKSLKENYALFNFRGCLILKIYSLKKDLGFLVLHILFGCLLDNSSC